MAFLVWVLLYLFYFIRSIHGVFLVESGVIVEEAFKYEDLTDKELYDGFDHLQENGRAVSVINGEKITWLFLIWATCPIFGPESKRKDVPTPYQLLTHAMYIASYEIGDILTPRTHIRIIPENSPEGVITATCCEPTHRIVQIFREHHLRKGGQW